MHVQHFHEDKISGRIHLVRAPRRDDLWRTTVCGAQLAPDAHVHTNPETAVTCGACIYEQARTDDAPALCNTARMCAKCETQGFCTCAGRVNMTDSLGRPLTLAQVSESIARAAASAGPPRTMPEVDTEDNRKKSPLETFDVAVSKVTTERGNVYGHPADDFAKVDAIKEAVRSCPDPLLRHCLEMIAVKMSRLAATPEHLDSWVDIFGYARCAVMIIDRRSIKSDDLTARRG